MFVTYLCLQAGSTYACEFCVRTYSRKDNLRRHIRTQHENGRKPCNACGHLCRDEVELKNNIMSRYLEEGFKCAECSKCYRTKAGLVNHVSESHSHNSKYLCSTCGQTFVYKSDYETHVAKESNI